MRAAKERVFLVYLARIHVALGEKDQVFAWLRKGFDNRSDHILILGADPVHDPCAPTRASAICCAASVCHNSREIKTGVALKKNAAPVNTARPSIGVALWREEARHVNHQIRSCRGENLERSVRVAQPHREMPVKDLSGGEIRRRHQGLRRVVG
jgi:hypothetical protein